VVWLWLIGERGHGCPEKYAHANRLLHAFRVQIHGIALDRLEASEGSPGAVLAINI
jgi:hypothetical protein